jgi:hypothetical protein
MPDPVPWPNDVAPPHYCPATFLENVWKFSEVSADAVLRALSRGRALKKTGKNRDKKNRDTHKLFNHSGQ